MAWIGIKNIGRYIWHGENAIIEVGFNEKESNKTHTSNVFYRERRENEHKKWTVDEENLLKKLKASH